MKDSQNQDTNIVKLSDEDAVREIIIESVFNLWKTVNNLTRLRPSQRKAYRVTLFGSARVQEHSFAYQQVKELAKHLAEMGCDIVSGGGPGLMQAANEGANEGANKGEMAAEQAGPSQGNRSIGIRVHLPFEQEVNPFVQKTYEHETFFSRLHHFVLASDAFVIVPGGIGTTLEAMIVWQLLQVGHIDKQTPLIFIGKMWIDFLEWARMHFLPHQLANPEDLQIPYCVSTIEEAIAILKTHKENRRS